VKGYHHLARAGSREKILGIERAVLTGHERSASTRGSIFQLSTQAAAELINIEHRGLAVPLSPEPMVSPPM
jgi:hypothetical protein